MALKKWNLKHIPLVLMLIFAVGPLVLLFVNSVKTKEEFNVNPFGLPSKITFQNFATAWERANYAQAFTNSIIIGAVTIVIVCVCAGLCAYALSKMEFKGANAVMVFLLITMSVPMGLFLVPLFFLWQKLNLMDSMLGIILIYSAIYLPFNVFLLRSYFIGIPKEIVESAKVDGCNEIQVLLRIIVPIAKPAFLTVALLVGLWTWNEFFFANAFLLSEEMKTVATRYIVFTGRFSADWSLISAAGVITTLPFVIIYLLLQQRFIEGMTEGSIKG